MLSSDTPVTSEFELRCAFQKHFRILRTRGITEGGSSAAVRTADPRDGKVNIKKNIFSMPNKF